MNSHCNWRENGNGGGEESRLQLEKQSVKFEDCTEDRNENSAMEIELDRICG